MREFGYVEGKDFVGEARYADGNYERLPDLAAELVRSKVDIIVTGLTAGIRTLQQATSTIPIVMAYSTVPVGNGFVASLARPGGNVTGLTTQTCATSGRPKLQPSHRLRHLFKSGSIGNNDRTFCNSNNTVALPIAKTPVHALARAPHHVC
jgi:putative ABC transport system substrate-binding protein